MLKVAKLVACAALVGVMAMGVTASAQGHKAKGEKAGAAAASVETPKAVTDALTAAFPKATVGTAMLEKKSGQYNVTMKEDKSQFRVQVTDAGVIIAVRTEVAAADLPKAVTDAVTTAEAGATVKNAMKVEERADPKTLTKLEKPIVKYELTITKDDAMGRMTVGEDGKVVVPAKMQEMKKHGKKA